MQLLPSPQSLTLADGHIHSPPPQILLANNAGPSIRFIRALQTLGFSLSSASQTTLDFPSPHAPKNGYTLKIHSNGIDINAYDEASAFYALATLRQLRTLNPDEIPCLSIEDWPDLPIRGFMLDISRCKVPTQQSLFELVDTLSFLKYNQLQLYTEHTFAYRNHKVVWQDADPLTPQDILQLDQYCHDRYIELVPNQNSFGHMERWLRHPEYHHLAESPNGFEHPLAGWKEFGSTLKPTQESADFVDSLYAEFLRNFRSENVNIGGDEPWELGQGFSRETVATRGKTRVYLDHLLRIKKKIRDRDKRMQFWGDIIIEHPEMAKELGDEVTALLWGYEVDHPFEAHCSAMQTAGAHFYVVPGTSTWNSIGGRLHTALPNITAAATNAKRFGASGLLLTEWGDNGHHQSHLLAFPAIALAAALSWSSSSPQPDLRTAATQLFPHPVSVPEYNTIVALSQIAGDFSKHLHNQSWLNKILFAKPDSYATLAPELSEKELLKAQTALASISSFGELELARRLLAYATEKGLALVSHKEPPPIPQGLLNSFRSHWLKRNRLGGLTEALALLKAK